MGNQVFNRGGDRQAGVVSRVAAAAFAVVALSLLAMGCGTDGGDTGTSGSATTTTAGKSAATPKALRVGYLPALCQSAVVLNPLQLIEKKLGVPVEWHQYSAGPPLVQGFAQGQLDMGFLGMAPTLIAVDKGIPIRAVASTHTEGADLISRALPEYRNLDELGDLKSVLEQFRGKVIGVPAKGSIQDSIIRDVLRSAGLVPDKDVTVLNVQAAPSLPDMLAKGDIDAMVAWPPFGTKAVMAGSGKVLVDAHDLWPDAPLTLMAFSQDMIDTYPEFVGALVALHAQASTFIMAYPDQAAQVAADFLGLPYDLARQSFDDNPKYTALPGPGFLAATDRLAVSLKESGYVEHDLRSSDVFDLSFISGLGLEGQGGVGEVPKDPGLYTYIMGVSP
jgi:NitT/TauT family transport system substrate-binding protein